MHTLSRPQPKFHLKRLKGKNEKKNRKWGESEGQIKIMFAGVMATAKLTLGSCSSYRTLPTPPDAYCLV